MNNIKSIQNKDITFLFNLLKKNKDIKMIKIYKNNKNIKTMNI